MNEKIDVLAVMDRAAESAGKIVKESNGDFRAVIYQDDLFKARAAIAELIEAGEEFASCDSLDTQKRFKAALARVGGGK